MPDKLKFKFKVVFLKNSVGFKQSIIIKPVTYAWILEFENKKIIKKNKIVKTKAVSTLIIWKADK